MKKTRGGSRAAATSKMERFVILVNGWKPFILDGAAALDPPLKILIIHLKASNSINLPEKMI